MIKLRETMMILDLHRQGLSVSAIARQTGIDRKTVRKYIERGLEAPAYGPRKPRSTVIDPFAGYLRERVKAHLRARAERSICDLWDTVGNIVKLFEPHEWAHYFAACGYDPD